MFFKRREGEAVCMVGTGNGKTPLIFWHCLGGEFAFLCSCVAVGVPRLDLEVVLGIWLKASQFYLVGHNTARTLAGNVSFLSTFYVCGGYPVVHLGTRRFIGVPHDRGTDYPYVHYLDVTDFQFPTCPASPSCN